MTTRNLDRSARRASLNFSRFTFLGFAYLNLSFDAPSNSAATVPGGTPLTTFEGLPKGR